MAKVVAKAKARRAERQTRIEEEEQLEKAMTEHVKVISKKDRQTDSDVSFGEMRNVIADSLERLWEELHASRDFHGTDHTRLNAEEGARTIASSLTHGIGDYGKPVRIREEDMGPVPLCKEHK
jgi:hypothetical protein